MAGFSFGGRKGGFEAARQRFLNASRKFEERQWLVVQRAALLMERELKKGIRSGRPGGKKFKKLAPTTRLLRRGSKPLIDTSALLGSITTTLIRHRKAAFVGVNRKSSRPGYSTFNVAIAHEFGTKPFVIPVTDKVRRFFWYLHVISGGKIKPLSENKTQILHPGVPARPFIKPTLDKVRPKLQAVLAKTFVEGRGPF